MLYRTMGKTGDKIKPRPRTKAKMKQREPGKRRAKVRELPTLGWREWVALPGLGISRIKAKIDSGARSSALHAFALKTFERDGRQYVHFKVHPIQRETTKTIVAEAEILEYRQVRSSSGHRATRPVILTDVEILGQTWAIEVTLVNRDEMGFRMLLGREAVRGRWLIDSGRSYYGGRNVKRRSKKKRKAAAKSEERGMAAGKRKKKVKKKIRKKETKP